MIRKRRPGSLRVVVAGMVAGVPGHGGATWAVLQYLLGLRRLGHSVMLVDPVGDDEETRRPPLPLAATPASRYLRAVTRRFGLEGSAALVHPERREAVGLPYRDVVEFCKGADLLLNLSGLLQAPELLDSIPIRVYLDLDPAFTQLWHAVEGIDMGFEGHHRFVTVGASIGRAGCPVPTCGLTWLPTRPPVVLEAWPAQDATGIGVLTTVANWRGYGSVEHEGVFYGQKAHALRKIVGLPLRSAAPLLLALNIHPDETRDLAALRQGGWKLVDPRKVAGTPDAYAGFVRHSRGEIGIAKTGYTLSRCGWFSDRSVCYLASGRPVVAQDTGFVDHLPVGNGLLAFSDEDEAAAAIDRLHSNPDAHEKAARELAEAYFDSDRVLGRLLDLVGAAHPGEGGTADRGGGPNGGGIRSGLSEATLKEALGGGPSGKGGGGPRVLRLDRRLSPYASSLRLEEVDAILDDGSVVRAVLKEFTLQGGAKEARAGHPAFLDAPRREIETYRRLLAPRGLGPALLGAPDPDQESPRWLLLERPEARPLVQEGDFEAWLSAARWLARLHVLFPGRPLLEECRRGLPLIRYDQGYLESWTGRARSAVRAGGATPELDGAPVGPDVWNRVWEAHDAAAARLGALPPTLVHGDFYASNVLVARPNGGRGEASPGVPHFGVWPVDWELAGVGSGLLDLAALVAGSWSRSQRCALALAYLDEARGPGGPLGFPTEEAFLGELDLARLHVAVRWLASSPGWHAPREQAWEWAREAVILSRAHPAPTRQNR